MGQEVSLLPRQVAPNVVRVMDETQSPNEDRHYLALLSQRDLDVLQALLGDVPGAVGDAAERLGYVGEDAVYFLRSKFGIVPKESHDRAISFNVTRDDSTALTAHFDADPITRITVDVSANIHSALSARSR